MAVRSIGLSLAATAIIFGWADLALAQQEPITRPFTVRPAPRGPLEEKQPLVRGETVATRPRPEYDPLGIRAGGFLVFPQISAFQGYNSNVFASDDNVKDDFFLNLVPALSVQSDWNRHAVNFSTGANYTKYYEYTRQDYTDWFVGSNGRIDITRDAALFLGGGFARRHELPGTPDFQSDAREPTPFNVANGLARYVQQFGRFRATVDGTIENFDYKNSTLLDGREQSNDIDDYTLYAGGVRLGYELFPNYEAFVRAGGNRRAYDKTSGSFNQQTVVNGQPTTVREPVEDRSSEGYTAVTGVALDLGGILFGELYIGYLQQFYDSDEFNTQQGVDGGGSLTWNITTLTTATARVAREINATTQRNASGVLTTLAGLDVDHELLRNVVLNANFTYVNDEYDGNGDFDRTDNYYIAGIGGRYLINRNFNASLGYRFVRRSSDSDTGNFDYTRNLVRIGVQAQM
jgi:hypothetical protein